MEQVSLYKFKEQIALDFGLNPQKEYTLKLPADKKNVKGFTASRAHEIRIFDGEKEHPYMIDYCKRNDEVLKNGVELRCLSEKPLTEILKEAGITLESKKCKISEGGGWYTDGVRLHYKDQYCEI